MTFYSAIIRNAKVFDGLGQPANYADVGLESDKITAVGDLAGETAQIEIDATGLYAAPGFIDITNHSDSRWTLFDYPLQESYLRQGVATIIGGNCGISLAPVISKKGIEGIQRWSAADPVNLNWQSVQEFLTELKRHPLGLNFGTLVGHGTLRLASLTEAARPASSEEAEKMKFLLRQALEAGAFGLSTSLGRGHSLLADDSELLALLAEVKEAGGIATHHLESEGSGVLESVSRIAALSRASGAPAHISHFKILGSKSWPRQKSALEIIERARSDGLDMTIDVFPYVATGSELHLLLPSWALEGGKAETLKNLRDQTKRNQIIAALKALTLHYEKIIIASTLIDTRSAGKTIKTLAQSAGLEPEEFLLDLLLANNLEASIFNETISEANMLEALSKDYAIAASDGFGLDLSPGPNLPHPRAFGAFPRALNLLVKEKSLLTWEAAIYKMTGLPARTLGLEKRGVIKEGNFADIVIFDAEGLKETSDYQNPRRFSEGVRWLFINGEPVLSEGVLTGKLSGRVLRRNQLS